MQTLTNQPLNAPEPSWEYVRKPVRMTEAEYEALVASIRKEYALDDLRRVFDKVKRAYPECSFYIGNRKSPGQYLRITGADIPLAPWEFESESNNPSDAG